MTTTTLTIHTDNLRGEAAPLYHKYPREFNPQPAYIEMDEDGEVRADYSGEIGNAVPMYVWHRRTLRWRIDAAANGDSLADFLESDEARALLERIHAGHEVDWDGNNHSGSLDDDAQAASDELDSILEEDWQRPYDTTEVWDAANWLGDLQIDQLIEQGIDGYAAAAESNLDHNQSVDGDLAEATASQAADAVQRHIDREIIDAPQIRQVAEMLAEYSPTEYADLLAAYKTEFDDSDE